MYFAYGSNTDPFQMRIRCRNARRMGAARLDGYRLCFPRFSPVRASALASLEPWPDGEVWGVLYELSEADLVQLDAREGYRERTEARHNPANRVPVTVFRGGEGPAIAAFTYLPTPTAVAGLPSTDYLAIMIRFGREIGFPEAYLQALEGVPTVAAA